MSRLSALAGALSTLMLALVSCQQTASTESIEQIEAALDEGRFDAALTMLDEQIGSGTKDAKLLMLRGIAYLELDQAEKAVADLRRAAEADPSDASIAVNLGAARIAAGSYDEAIAGLDAALAKDEDDADAYRNRALALLRNGQHGPAVADYTRAMALYEGLDPVLYEERAECWEALGNTDQAAIDGVIADTTYQLDENPEDAAAFLERGVALYNIGEYYLALLDLDEAIEGGQTEDRAFLARGNALFVMGEPEDALKDIDQAIRLNANNADAYCSRANLHEEQENYSKAISDYEAALKIDPASELAESELAWLLATCPKSEVRDVGRAVQLAESASQRSAWKHWRPVVALAAAHAAKGEFDKAVAFQEKAIALAPAIEMEGLQETLAQFQAGKPVIWTFPELDTAE